MSGKILDHQGISLTDIGIKKPSSTWTYMINDNPFGNQLSVMLLDNSNIGLQANPVSNIMLGFYGVVEKVKRLIRKEKY